MYSSIVRIEPVVKEVLEEVEETRSDDFLLEYEVVKRIAPEVINLSFEEVMLNHRDYRIPIFESIRRSRQKLQAKYQHLLPPEKVQKLRKEKEEDYRSYALD